MTWNRVTVIALVVCPLLGCNSGSGVANVDSNSTKLNEQEPSLPVESVPAILSFEWQTDGEVVRALIFSPDDRRLIAFVGAGKSPHQTVLVIDIASQTEIYRTQALFPLNACLSPDEVSLALLSYDGLNIHSLENGEILTLTEELPNEGEVIGFSADGTILACAVSRRIGELKYSAWNLATHEEMDLLDQPVIWHGGRLSSDGTIGAYGGWPGPTPRIHRIDNGEPVGYCFYEEWLVGASFIPNGHDYLTIHEDGMLIIWDLEHANGSNASQSATASGYLDVATFAVTHDAKFIAVADSEGKVRIEQLPTSATPAS